MPLMTREQAFGWGAVALLSTLGLTVMAVANASREETIHQLSGGAFPVGEADTFVSCMKATSDPHKVRDCVRYEADLTPRASAAWDAAPRARREDCVRATLESVRRVERLGRCLGMGGGLAAVLEQGSRPNP